MKPLLLLALVAVLLLGEPDFGAATVLLRHGFGMLFIAGARLRYVLVLMAVAAALFALLAVTSAYRLRRLTGFLDPWAHAYGSGFQLTQSLIAIGRGQWLGVGLGNSVQKLFYLPEAHTDFLFAVLAEELGLLGVLLALGLFVGLIWRAFYIARLASQAGLDFQSYLAAGFTLVARSTYATGPRRDRRRREGREGPRLVTRSGRPRQLSAAGPRTQAARPS